MWSLDKMPDAKMYEISEELIICTPKTHVLKPDEITVPPLKIGPKIQGRLPNHFGSFELNNPIMESPSKPSRVKGKPFSNQVWKELGMDSPLLAFSDDETLSDTSSIISPVSDASSVSSSSPDEPKAGLYRHFADSADGEDLGLLPISAPEDDTQSNDLPLQLLFTQRNTECNCDGDGDQEDEGDGEDEENEEEEEEEEEEESVSKKRSYNQQADECLKRKCQPHHTKLTPHKSSLKLRPNALNFVMHSSNGNVKDATIFATEINSCNGYGVPFPCSVMERVTIPVNTQIKEHYKNEKGKQLNGYYDDDDEEDDNTKDVNGFEGTESFHDDLICNHHQSVEDPVAKDDSAIIRAFEFERLVTFDLNSQEKDCSAIKQVKWVKELEC